jgi:hypothetical protein
MKSLLSYRSRCELVQHMVSRYQEASRAPKILFLDEFVLWFCRLHRYSHAKELLKDCRVLRRHPGPSSCRCGMRPLVHRQQLIELPRGHRLSEQGANPQRPGGVVDDIIRVSRYFSTLLRISDATVSFRHPATRISAPSIGPVVNPNGILASIPEGSWCICASSWHRSPGSCLEHRPVECLD